MAVETHVAIPGSRRTLLTGAKVIGPADPHSTVELLLKLRRRRPVGNVNDRPSVALDPAQMATEFGAESEDVRTVVSTVHAMGFAVRSVDHASRSVVLRGSVAVAEAAFLVKLYEYRHPDGNYRGRVGEVFVPAALHSIVVGVFGLDERRAARRRRRAGLVHVPLQDPDVVPDNWYVPEQLARRYNCPPGDGTGQIIGLLEFGGGYLSEDLQRFCSLAGIGVPTVLPVSVDGTPTDTSDDLAGEVMLDIEVVAGLCPPATIVVYFAAWGERGWLQCLDKAVHAVATRPSVISVSWGSPEDTDIWTRQAMEQINETLKDAALTGVTVCVASGDDGSSDAVADGAAHADFPSSSPYVLAVGGTAIPNKSAPLPDIAWFEGDGLREQGNFDSGSTGGGVSAVYPCPPWQQAVKVASVNPGAIEGRCVPDVCANADWTVSPYLLCVKGRNVPNGGTSAAGPPGAGMVARINAQRGQPLGYLTPALYQPGPDGRALGLSVCQDVVKGHNATAQAGGYSAGTGYDAVSGWGTVDGSRLAAATLLPASPAVPQPMPN